MTHFAAQSSAYRPDISLYTGQPLQRNQAVFRHFIQSAPPSPPPGKLDFYLNNVGRHFMESYEEGWSRYFKMMGENPMTAALITSVTLALGLGMTALKHQKTLIKALFLGTAILWPAKVTLENISKMEEGYELTRAGEPTKGNKKFRQGMDEVIYQVFHNYLKPLTFGLFVIYGLFNFKSFYIGGTRYALQKVARWMPNGSAPRKALRWVDRQLKILGKWGPIARLNQKAEAMAAWGDRLFQANAPTVVKQAADRLKQATG